MKYKMITVKEFVEGNYFENETENERFSFTIDQFEGFGNETKPTNELKNETGNEKAIGNEQAFKNETNRGNEPEMNPRNELEMNQK